MQDGDEFRLKFIFGNAGNVTALNAQAAFTSADLIPTRTGGVAVVGSIAPGGSGEAGQTFMAVASLSGKTVVVVDVTLTYYDDKGTTYSDKFTVSVPASGGYSGVAYPTSTPTGVNSAQLVITSYATTVDPSPAGGTVRVGHDCAKHGQYRCETRDHDRWRRFLGQRWRALRRQEAHRAAVVNSPTSRLWAPPTSNPSVIFRLGGALQVRQNLIVNVSTDPGAYPMKITFSYVNGKGEVVNDDQVITLLVYSLPKLDISFYRDPGQLDVAERPDRRGRDDATKALRSVRAQLGR